jgi:3-oxoacyl-[acyl-carrier protein] reductase
MGRAIALAFAHEGANVTIFARTESDLRRTELELARVNSQQHVLAVPGDIANPRDIRRVVRDTVSRFGQINVLVTQMGDSLIDGPAARPSELQDDIILTTLDERFLSAVRFAKEVVPYMKQQRWGRIVNLMPHFSLRAIPVGSIRSTDESVLSASNRMALGGYAKSMANELAPFNITVNNLIHGLVDGEALTAVLQERSEIEGLRPSQLLDQAASLVPMGRLGRPEEVADLAAYLCSDRASYLTGANIVLDGGMRQDIR